MTAEELIEVLKKIQHSSATPEERLSVLKEIKAFMEKFNKALKGAVSIVDDDNKIQELRKSILSTKG